MENTENPKITCRLNDSNRLVDEFTCLQDIIYSLLVNDAVKKMTDEEKARIIANNLWGYFNIAKNPKEMN